MNDASISCTHSYTILATDLNATHDASITNHAVATGRFLGSPVTSNEATATINQVPPSARITDTDTTCQQFKAGFGNDLTDEFYGVKQNKIANISPGRFFYYSAITAPSSAFTVEVRQSNTLGWKPMDIAQVVLWGSSCTKTQATVTTVNGKVTLQVTGLTAGATYYLAIKYDPKQLIGQNVGPTPPTSVYTFLTYLNGSKLIASQDSVNVQPR